jgi:hypothetical protein
MQKKIFIHFLNGFTDSFVEASMWGFDRETASCQSSLNHMISDDMELGLILHPFLLSFKKIPLVLVLNSVCH